MNALKALAHLAPALGALLMLVPHTAAAQDPRYLDETDMQVRLHSVPGANDQGAYQVVVEATVYNRIGASDAIRMDVKVGNRVVATARCEFGGARDNDGGAGALDCTTPEGTDITAVGPVRVDLTYLDDQDGSATLLRTLNLRVVRYWSWEGMNGNRPTHRAHFQLDGSDFMGVAYAYHISPNADYNRGRDQIKFYFWTSSGRSGSRNLPADLNNASMRCTVDGARLHDLQVGTQTSGSEFEEDNRVYTNHAPQDGDVEHWSWNRVELMAYGLYWGTHADAVTANINSEPDPNRSLIMGDHPGAWVCGLRSSGRVVREFRFTVGADGRIVQHAELVGPGAMHVVPGVVMVDTRFGNPEDFDFVFNPAAIRASAPFGRPWTHPEAVRDMLAALPAAVGTADPAVVPAGQGRTPPAAAGGHHH